EEKLTKQTRDAANRKYAVLQPSQFDDHEIITLLERTPTFNRDPKVNEEITRLGRGQQASPYHQPSEPSQNQNSSGDGLKIQF
ncbi:MAG: hypothetical protein K2M62_04625, partial [Muribaculaceae bacterium]|nr:hypothetical protein [Muribaculaceae bacterium]